jgi:molecular chaperone DnaK
VITVPAYFNDSQRQATKDAGRIAGLNVQRIINEPTAAALAYGPPGKAQERIAVYDLGGGTFDVTLLDLAGNVFEVLATAGDTALGGDDIDLVVAERMADDLLKTHRFDARAQPLAFAKLRLYAERMKRELSTAEEYTLVVDDLVPGDRGRSVKWNIRMTRPELEWASLALVERTFAVCQRALDAAGARPGELDRVVLVGGATRMPMVARKVEQFFGRPPIVRINPDEVVSLGAAIQAALLDRGRQKTREPMVHPIIDEHSIVEPAPMEAPPPGEVPMLPLVGPHARVVQPREEVAAHVAPDFLPGISSRPLVFDMPAQRDAPRIELELAQPEPTKALKPPPLPAKRTLRLEPPPPLAEATPPLAASHTMSIPVEAIAPPKPRPAAPLLIDVTPLSLCVETVGGFCDVLIDANTPVPCDRTRPFATASDGQTVVRVRVAQGASKRFAENTFLGELELQGIAAAPRGETRIAVTFEIDADGILNVRARDMKTGQETAASMQLVGAHAGPADIEAMQARQMAHPLAPL